MPAFTHARSISYTLNGGVVATQINTQSGDEETDIDTSIAPSTTNQSFNLAVTIANAKSILLYADQALTLKTNSSGSPQDTINLAAGQMIPWQTGDTAAAPFSGNVTALFVTNASATLAANLKVRVLQNQ